MHSSLQGKILILKSCNCLCSLIHLGRKLHGNLTVLFVYHVQIVKHPSAGYHFHTHTLAELDHRKELHHSNLTGTSYMGSTAGAGICSRKSDNTHPAGKLFLASVFQFLKLFL